MECCPGGEPYRTGSRGELTADCHGQATVLPVLDWQVAYHMGASSAVGVTVGLPASCNSSTLLLDVCRFGVHDRTVGSDGWIATGTRQWTSSAKPFPSLTCERVVQDSNWQVVCFASEFPLRKKPDSHRTTINDAERLGTAESTRSNRTGKSPSQRCQGVQ